MAGLSSIVSTTTLNSVNQIILNFNQSNYSTNDQRYRPVVIFYDGPETYSIYSDYDTENKFVRKSKPVIVNLNAPYRGIFYMPNSPVVVIGDHKDDFKGFIVAKEYLQLKGDDDFIDSSEVRYFNKPTRQYEYTREVKADGTVQYRDLGGTKISTSVTKDEQAYRLKIYYKKGDTSGKRYYKVYGKNSVCPAGLTETTVTIDGKQYTVFIDQDGMKYIKTEEENGIEMYVDDYGNVQYMELENPPMKIGKYETFGRTDFSSHGYHILGDSAINLILSGN